VAAHDCSTSTSIRLRRLDDASMPVLHTHFSLCCHATATAASVGCPKSGWLTIVGIRCCIGGNANLLAPLQRRRCCFCCCYCCWSKRCRLPEQQARTTPRKNATHQRQPQRDNHHISDLERGGQHERAPWPLLEIGNCQPTLLLSNLHARAYRSHTRSHAIALTHSLTHSRMHAARTHTQIRRTHTHTRAYIHVYVCARTQAHATQAQTD
jgi:hypothetical protein